MLQRGTPKLGKDGKPMKDKHGKDIYEPYRIKVLNAFRVLGLISMVVALLGVAVLITYSLQNGIILLVIAFLISPYGLPMAAIWLLGKVQDLKFIIQDLVYG